MPRNVFEEQLANVSSETHTFLLDTIHQSRAASCCELNDGSIMLQMLAFQNQCSSENSPSDLRAILERAQNGKHSHVHFRTSEDQTDIGLAFDYFYRRARRAEPTTLQAFTYDRLVAEWPLTIASAMPSDYCDLLQTCVADIDTKHDDMSSNQHQFEKLWVLAHAISDAKPRTPGEWWLCDELVRILISLLDYIIQKIGVSWTHDTAGFEQTVFAARSSLACSIRSPIATRTGEVLD